MGFSPFYKERIQLALAKTLVIVMSYINISVTILKMFRFKLFIFSFLIAGYCLNAQSTVWLDQLDLSVVTQGHGKPGINTSVDGKPITIAGEVFKRGFGTHAESSLLIKLNGKAKALPQWWEWMMKSKGRIPLPNLKFTATTKTLVKRGHEIRR